MHRKRPAHRVAHDDDGQKLVGQGNHMRRAVFPAQTFRAVEVDILVNHLAHHIGGGGAFADHLKLAQRHVIHAFEIPALGGYGPREIIR